MAVTQNLARASQQVLDECRQSTEVLDEVCSFKRLPAHDYLSADWAPGLLLAAARAEGLATSDSDRLRRTFMGDAELNPAYRDVPNSIWEHPVTVVDRIGAREIASTLTRLVRTQFPSLAAVEAAFASWPDRPSEPRTYLRQHLETVAAFYQGAIEQQMGILAWWD